MHHVLRPIFVDQIPDQSTYDSDFDRTEVMLAALAQDQAITCAAADPDRWPVSRTDSYWFGRSTWRAAHSYGNPVEELSQELATQGALWGPLQDNLFGADQQRAQAALEQVAQDFESAARRRG